MNETQENLGNQEQMDRDYQASFVPRVHTVGQVTLIVGALMMFLPGLILYYGLGYRDVPLSSVLAFAAFYLPLCASSQLTEHLRYYPMMGAASTYISYLAGSGTTLRLPVAQSCASIAKADMFSARAQILVIVGEFVAVVVNNLIVLLVVLFGGKLLQYIPDVVRSAFNYITVVVFGHLLVMNIKQNGRGDLLRGAKEIGWPLGVAAAGHLIFRVLLKSVPGLSNYSILLILFFALAVFVIKQMIEDKKAQSGTTP